MIIIPLLLFIILYFINWLKIKQTEFKGSEYIGYIQHTYMRKSVNKKIHIFFISADK